jgi:hypothetical protein
MAECGTRLSYGELQRLVVLSSSSSLTKTLSNGLNLAVRPTVGAV